MKIILLVSLVLLTLWPQLGNSQTYTGKVTSPQATSTAVATRLAERRKEKSYPVFSGDPTFFVYSMARFKTGQELESDDYLDFVNDLKSKSLAKINNADSSSDIIPVPPDLVPDSLEPALDQKVWTFVSNAGNVVCSPREVNVTDYYLDESGLTGDVFIQFKTDGPSGNFFASIPPNTRPEKGILTQKDLTLEQINAILKLAADTYKNPALQGTPIEIYKKFNSVYVINKSFDVEENDLIAGGGSRPIMQVVQLANRGAHVLCLIKIGDDLIIQDHSDVLKITMFNKKIYFLFEGGNGYEASNEVFELNGSKLKKVYSQTVGTD